VERFVERRACPVCGELRHEVLRSAAFTAPEVWEFIERYYAGRIRPGDLEGGLYQVRRCHACRFLWQAFHLDEAGMGALYERWISPEDSLAKKTRADVSLYDGYAREISSIARRLERKPHQLSLLDFGMGWGAWCRMAQAYGYTVAGFELSQRRREHARAWGIRVVDSLEAPERYDYINCHHALEHVPDPHQTLARLVAALAPGGLVRLSVPDGGSMEQRLRPPRWGAEKYAKHPHQHPK
jgi:SAM-dependent methyltransferase